MKSGKYAEKTKGYMAGDNQWILILKKEENL